MTPKEKKETLEMVSDVISNESNGFVIVIRETKQVKDGSYNDGRVYSHGRSKQEILQSIVQAFGLDTADLMLMAMLIKK